MESLILASHLLARVMVCAVLLSGAADAVTTDADASSGPDLAGDHVIVDTRSGTELHRTRVEVSPRGMRVSNLLDGRSAIMNFALERYWFIDRTRRLVHEVPIRTVPGRVVPVGDAGGARGRVVAGVFAPVPCAGHRVGSSTNTTWRGRQLLLVDCIDVQGELVSLDYYSPELSTVVRNVARNGVAEEFQDVRRVLLDDARFLPPKGYRTVDLDELKGERGPLPSYGRKFHGIDDTESSIR